MNIEMLLQNLFYLFILAIIIEASVMALFSISIFKGFQSNRIFEMTRDFIILGLAFFLCFKLNKMSLFRGTGITLGKIDIVISALVLTRMATFIKDFWAKVKQG